MIIVSLIAPFLILIRLSVYLIQVEQWNGWIALGAGAGVTFLFVLIVFLLLFRKFAGRSWVIKSLVAVSLIMVSGFCIYGLSYLSGVHAKTDQVRDVYRSLHPVLRVAVASVTLADQSLIITDIQRTPDDYKKMGLSPLQSSLHYIQPTGFVHAIDLRTIGHSELRNKTLEFTLKVMGFSTLRHVGTADHLHISLPIK